MNPAISRLGHFPIHEKQRGAFADIPFTLHALQDRSRWILGTYNTRNFVVGFQFRLS
jgi:hypothetical protein